MENFPLTTTVYETNPPMFWAGSTTYAVNTASSSGFVFRMAEASAKRVTGDEPQGTMGRV